MAIYNIGKLDQPQEQENPYMKYLMQAGNTALENQSREKINIQNLAAQAQIKAAELQQKADEQNKENLDIAVELGVDKFGRKNFAKFIETDKGYSALYKEYLKYHPEFKGIDDIEATLPEFTKRQVEAKYQEQQAKVEESLRAGRVPTAQDLGQMTYLLDLGRKQLSKIKYDDNTTEYDRRMKDLLDLQGFISQRAKSSVTGQQVLPTVSQDATNPLSGQLNNPQPTTGGNYSNYKKSINLMRGKKK